MKKIIGLTLLLVCVMILASCKTKTTTTETTTVSTATSSYETGFTIQYDAVKVNYDCNEELSLEGLVVKVLYSDGSQSTITSGYTVDTSQFNKQVAGTYEIRVTYKDFEAQTFEVTVHELEAIDLVIDTTYTKKVYKQGEYFNSMGLIVKELFKDNTEELVTNYEINTSRYNKDVLGTYEIFVTYGNFTKTFEVTVVAPIVTGIKVVTDQVKKDYFIGETLNLDGLVVKLTYDNNTETVLETGYEINSTAFNSSQAGSYDIIVKYGEYESKTFTVNVKVAQITGIVIDSSLVKLEYKLNEPFDSTGLVVKLVYEDGKEVVTTEYEIDSTLFNKQLAGTYTISVKYQTFDVKTFDVVVLNKMDLSTPSDVEVMILLGGANEYTLLNDIDMTGVTTLTGGTTSFSGILDGKGYTIKGLEVTATGNKMGIFFKEVLDGGIVRNIQFENSIYYGGGTGEASAFITAYAHGGSTFENIVFTNVSVTHAGSYAALVFGDTKEASDKPITVTKITVNNDELHEIRGKSYVGGVVGRLNHTLTLNMSYIYFNSQVRAGVLSGDVFTPDQASGALIGRLVAAGTIVNVDNVVINSTVNGSKNVGAIIGTSVASTTLNSSNVLINHFTGISGTNRVDVLVGNPNSMVINEVNTFYINENLALYQTSDLLTSALPTQAVGMALEDVSLTWFNDVSGLDKDYWVLYNKDVLIKNQGSKIYLSTPDDIAQMVSTGGDIEYILANDVDMSTYTTLTGGHELFSGIFDGRGHKISGLNVTADNNKMGIFFKEALAGSVIKNITFEDSIYNGGGTGEASAFIVAYAHGGSTFENITFRNVTVAHAGSYAALVFGDTKAVSELPIILKNISVYNDASAEVRGKSYVGGLVGRLNHTLTLDLSYIYFNSQVRAGVLSGDVFTPDQAGGALIGRLVAAGTVVNLDNVVINGTVYASKNVGAVIGTSVANTTLNTNNVVINSFTGISGTNKVDVLVGNPNSMVINSVNTVYVQDNLSLYQTSDLSTPATPTQATGIQLADLTDSWFTQSGLDTSYFKLSNGYIVVNQDNSGSIGTETGFIIITSLVDKLYVEGEALDLSGLVVKAIYSDGSRVELTSEQYIIDQSNFVSTAGTYVIKVIYGNYEPQTFEVEVVSVSGFNVYCDDVRRTYLMGENLSLTGLVVKAVLSDQSEITLNSSDYVVNSNTYNKDAAGEYEITISYRDYSPVIIKVTVIDDSLTYTDTVATIRVDATYAGVDGDVANNMNQFKTMKAALDYLTLQNLPSTTEKIIYIANGTYVEKLTISLPNLTLIGEDANLTVLSYYVRSGDKKPDGTTWGTQGSASVTIKSSAVNFQAKNLTIENSYDYFGGVANGVTSDVQAVALVTEADMVSFYNVRFLGSQDTLYAKSGRQYYYNCYIEGVVDFIFGNAGPAYFENSTIVSQNRSSGVITAQKGAETSGVATYGYVFYNSTLSAEEGTPANSVHLGRPWGADASVAYINCTMGDHIASVGWTDMSGNIAENANFFEFGSVDASLNPIVRDPSVYRGTILTQEQANQYNKDNVFATTNGTLTFSTTWDYASDMTALMNSNYVE